MYLGQQAPRVPLECFSRFCTALTMNLLPRWWCRLLECKDTCLIAALIQAALCPPVVQPTNESAEEWPVDLADNGFALWELASDCVRSIPSSFEGAAHEDVPASVLVVLGSAIATNVLCVPWDGLFRWVSFSLATGKLGKRVPECFTKSGLGSTACGKVGLSLPQSTFF